MAMTALRNKRGVMGKPAVAPTGGAPDPATLNRLHQTARSKGPESAHTMIGQTGGAQTARPWGLASGGEEETVQHAHDNSGSGLEGLAPRYQEMIRAGVDPSVVAARAKAFQGGQLPGQTGQIPGIGPDAPSGGPIAKPAQRPSGQFAVAPGAGVGPRPYPLPGPGGFGGGPTPLPANIGGGFLSPGAWGALGGGGNLLGPAGFTGPGAGLPSPGQGLPYGNDAQAREIGSPPGGLTPMVPNEPPQGGPLLPNGRPMQNVIAPEPSQGGLQSMNGGGLQTPGRPDMQSVNGGGFQSGPPVPPMANAPTATPDPQQVRQASVARALAGRMAGGAFSQ